MLLTAGVLMKLNDQPPTGQTLDVAFRNRVLEPLGMVDTGFWCDPAQQERVSALYYYGESGLAERVTAFWVDPVEDVGCVFMTQLMPSSAHPIRSQLRQLVYSALV